MTNQSIVRAKKSFSQNFLHDANICKKIVNSLECTSHDSVLEIGPGMGALTKFILQQEYSQFTAVDLDKEVIEYLTPRIQNRNITLLQRDILQVQLNQIFPNATSIKVVGNLPYSITSEIFFWLFDQSQQIQRAVVMVQKEVAQRFVAKPRSKEYGILSVSSALMSTPKILFHVPPTCFTPQPKVTSSVVLFDFTKPLTPPNKIQFTQSFVRAAFSQRRKMLTNSLQSWFAKNDYSLEEVVAISEECGVPIKERRAEELSPEEFTRLTDALQTKKSLNK
jgi:16S rRNA (adenine1518-N6/adenine1519-N6)-dimethyltransferase